MNILGMGILFAGGSGISALERALREGWQPPSEAPGNRLAYQVSLNESADKAILKKIRRSDKLSQMSVLAAGEALRESGIENIVQKNIGIIVATAFGAHVTTFSFLDNILDYGDINVSPTTFSNSVHNAAASYIASSLGIKGPTLTVTQFRFSFHGALQLARTWLDLGRCDYVLVGAAEQYGDVLGYVSERKLLPSQDGKIKPFSFHPTCHVPGEGAVFFLVGKDRTEGVFCKIDLDPADEAAAQTDLAIIAADGIMPDESAYLDSLNSAVPAAGYSPLFGTVMNNGAFSVAAGACMIRNQELYASPVSENPHGMNVLATPGTSRIASICCIDCDCSGEKAILHLSRV